MRVSLYKLIAIVLIFAVGITMVAPIQIAEASGYLATRERTWVYLIHIDGDITGHVVKYDDTYADHESQGSHQHTTNTIDINAGTWNCPASSPSQCSYCGPE